MTLDMDQKPRTFFGREIFRARKFLPRKLKIVKNFGLKFLRPKFIRFEIRKFQKNYGRKFAGTKFSGANLFCRNILGIN